MEEYNPLAPVSITLTECDMSNSNRKRMETTVRQLPVMRAASNLAFVVAQVESHIPRSLRCHSDQLEYLTTRILVLIDLANEDRNSRYELLTEVHALLITLEIKIEILVRVSTGVCRKNIHTLSKDEGKKIKTLIKSVKSQVIGWRNSAK